MTHQKNPVESLREEFIKYKNHFANTRDWRLWNDDVITAWWLEKIATQREALLAETVEDLEKWLWENGITHKESAQALQRKLRLLAKKEEK